MAASPAGGTGSSGNAALMNELGFAIDEELGRPHWRKWAIVILLALLCHLLLSLFHLSWTGPSKPLDVEIHTVNPAQLEAVRKQWKHERSLLLDKDKSPSAKEAPKNARYFSDKNIAVQKEQRARITNVIPKPGLAGPPARSHARGRTHEQPRTQTKIPAQTLPNLGNLGVPLHLDRKPPPPTADHGPQEMGGDDAGDQSIMDRNLPMGSQNMLNAQESVYYSFYSRMYEAIAPVWQSHIREVASNQRVAAGEYTTVVDVVLDRNGNLVAVRRLQSSGVPAFDDAVDEALQRTGHFPNPPKGLLNKDGEVHTGWTFTVQLQQGTGFNFSPPERVY